MIVTVPAAMPVTRPDWLTVAFVASEVVHATVRPLSVFPVASSVATDSCAVAPPTVTLTVAGESTDATAGCDTVMLTCPLLPPALAMIDAVPALRPVITPALLTDATAVLLVDHETTPVPIGAPF